MSLSCRGLYRASLCTETISRCSPRLTSRPFSRTAGSFLRKSSYPAWVESPNEELNSFLIYVRQKQILPHYLNPEQRALVENPENRSLLESDPVTVRIGSEDATLEYTDLFKRAARKDDIKRVLNLIREPEDWQNLEKLLEAFAGSNNKLSRHHKELIIGFMLKHDQISLVLRILRNPDKYDFRPLAVNQMLPLIETIYNYARSSQWQEKETSSALTFAKIALDTLLHKRYLDAIERLRERLGSDHPDHKDYGMQQADKSPIFTAVLMRLVAALEPMKDAKVDTSGVPDLSSLVDHFIGTVDESSYLKSRMLNGPWPSRADFDISGLRPQTRMPSLRLNLMIWEAMESCRPFLEESRHHQAGRFWAIQGEIEQSLRQTLSATIQDSKNKNEKSWEERVHTTARAHAFSL